MTQSRLNRIQTVLRRRQLDCTVILDNVHKPHNLSAIMRTCDAIGIDKIHAVQNDGKTKTSSHTASGSQKWVTVEQHPTGVSAIHHLQQQGMKIYAAHLSEQAVDYRSIDYTQPVAILMGQEKWGVSEACAAEVDGHITIPMLGMVESLNVSVAAAVILYELQRQRAAKGMYEVSQFNPEELDRLTFEWSQPKMTRYYQRQNLPYPDLDEDGDIIPPNIDQE